MRVYIRMKKYKGNKNISARAVLSILVCLLALITFIGVLKTILQGNSAAVSLNVSFEYSGNDQKKLEEKLETLYKDYIAETQKKEIGWKDDKKFQKKEEKLYKEYVHVRDTLAAENTIIMNRLKMSRDINEEGQYYLSNTKLFGSVRSIDGTYLWGPLTVNCTSKSDEKYKMKKETEDAWISLLGKKSNFSGKNTSSKYLLDNYKDVLFRDIEFDVLEGFTCSYSPDITLTINSHIQEDIYEYLKENNIYGSVTAYNYETGNIICMASYGKYDNSNKEIEYNNSLNITSPGSTMKLITLFLLIDQDLDPVQMKFNCNGSYKLKTDGKVISCSGNHGLINGEDAIGRSCNCWFAQAIEKLNLTIAVKTLKEIGFDTNGKPHDKYIGKLKRAGSVTNINTVDNANFKNVWDLIGLIDTRINPIDMLRVIGCYATGGNAFEPRILINDSKEKISFGILNQKKFDKALEIWKKGFAEKYSITYKNLNENITVAKTGTNDNVNGKGTQEQKLLCGYSKKERIAFFIEYQNYAIRDQGSYSNLDIDTDNTDGWTKLTNIELEDIANKFMETLNNK